MPRSSRPLVTIAIPTYNRADAFLKDALTCSLNQTYPDLEILVSDNCSTDHTEDLVRAFKDSRLQYFRQPENIGANNNFNFCIEKARGDYLLLLLDDDLIDDDFVETCIRAIKGHLEVGIIRTGTRLIDGSGNVLFERPNRAEGLSNAEFVRAWFHNKTTLYVCSTLFNRKKLQELGGFGSRHNLFQDVMIEMRLALQHGRLDIADAKASFRRHDENMGSAAKISAWCEDSLDLLALICGLVPDESELLRTEGMSFLCRMNYSRAAMINSPLKRYTAYFIVARMFGFSYSPFRFAYQKDILPRVRQAKSNLEKIISG